MRQREDGLCAAYSKADGTAYTLKLSEFPRLKAEWMAGKAFFEGIGFYGAVTVIKLGDIVAISADTPECITFARADRQANEREDALQS